MGKKDKKKKGMGAQKTAAKTEKKLQLKQKKAMEAAGEVSLKSCMLQTSFNALL